LRRAGARGLRLERLRLGLGRRAARRGAEDARHDARRVLRGNPAIRTEVEGAVGYAVFDASQVNVVLYVGATGGGVMVDNANRRETFMTMARAGTGPGVGYKNYRQLMVFKDRTLFDTFSTVGADLGASADATFKTSDAKGVSMDGSTSFNPYLSVYQITDRGVLLQANWAGSPTCRTRSSTPRVRSPRASLRQRVQHVHREERSPGWPRPPNQRS
jgi:hypothetical protein